ncbi:MAG: hypothetical protein ACP5Q3_09885 [bacterium]
MGAEKRVGYRVVGTIKSIKGHCHAGHTVGQQIELSGHNTGGLCGFFYHDAFPYNYHAPIWGRSSARMGRAGDSGIRMHG